MRTVHATRRSRLLLQATATLVLVLLVGLTVLMHTMAGHGAGDDHPMAAPVASAEQHPDGAASVTGHTASVATAVLSAAGCDDGLCALLCSLMGMACSLVVALFAWVLLRARVGGVLALLSRVLALADRIPRRVAKPRPPSLTALQVIRT